GHRAGPRDRRGIVEILGDRALLFLGRRAHEPHEQEERHHCRGEVRERDFPRAAMMAVAVFANPLDDDGRARLLAIGLGVGHRRYCLRPRRWASGSLKLGRSAAGVALRPNSIATCGGWPCTKPRMQVLMVV